MILLVLVMEKLIQSLMHKKLWLLILNLKIELAEFLWQDVSIHFSLYKLSCCIGLSCNYTLLKTKS